MATASGTATDYLDLLTKFNTFVTATLPSVQRWTKLKDSVEGANDRNLYYSMPGLSGSDLIYVNLNAFHDTGSDYYNIGIRGTTGFNSGAPWNGQPGQSPSSYLLAWNTSIPYWFVGSGRRAIIIIKVSGVYQTAYMGFITPHFAPSEYAYPLFVGAAHSIATKRWSNIDFAFKNFWNPTGDPGTAAGSGDSGSYLLSPGRLWVPFANYSVASESSGNSTGNLIWPYCTQFEQVGKLYSGGSNWGLQPLVLHGQSEGGNNWGEFDGVYFISGFGQAAENVVVISSVNYLVVQNCFRSNAPNPSNPSSNQYAAIALA